MNVRIPILAVAAALAALPARADVSYTQEGKLTIQLPFGLGKVKTRTFLSGDRKREEVGDRQATITRLDEEVIDTLDLKKKTWYRTTFAEMRADLERALAEMDAAAKKDGGSKDGAGGKPTEVTTDLEVTETGRKATVAGHECSETRLRVKIEGKDPETGETGKLALDNDVCLGRDVPGAKEVTAFDRKFAEKLGAAQVFAKAGMFDMAQKKSDEQFRARVRMAEAAGSLEGFPLRIVTRFGPAETAAAEAPARPAPAREERQERPKGLGGLLGKLGKKDEGGDPGRRDEAGGAPGGFGFVLEVQELSAGSLDPALFEVPDGFRREPRPDPFKKK